MITFTGINRHWIGIPALALAVIGLGIVGNAAFKRTTASLSQIGSAEINQAASAPDIISQLKQIPKNAFGSAQPPAPSQYSLSGDQSSNSTSSESKNWTEEEWRLATAAVTAYRKGGKKALSPTASSNMVWQPPEEIANSNNSSGEAR